MSITSNTVAKSLRLGVCTLLLGATSLLAPVGNAFAVTTIMGETNSFVVHEYKTHSSCPTVGLPCDLGLSGTPDGKDEMTFFSIDVSGDPLYAQFLADPHTILGQLGSMVLTLTGEVGHNGIDSDWVMLESESPLHPGDVLGPLWNQTNVTFDIELLNHYDTQVHDYKYSAATILGYLNSENGVFDFKFADDLYITNAKLSLTTASVPEPGSLLLLGSGLVGLGAWRMKKK